MSIDELTKIIAECCHDVWFNIDGKKAGVTSEVEDRVPMFQAWCGDETKEYKTVDELLTDPFFCGKTLSDVVDLVSIHIL